MRALTYRIAWRDARRSKGRTALVLSMIGLPVLVITMLAVLLRTGEWSPRESLPYELGKADARFTAAGRAPVQQDPLNDRNAFDQGPGATAGEPWTTEEITRKVVAKYGPAARVALMETGKNAMLKTQRGVLDADVTEVDLRDPLAGGMFTITGGRAPATPDEIALAPVLEERGFALGGMAQVDPKGTRKRVVGYVEAPRAPEERIIVALPGAFTGQGTGTRQWLIGAGRDVTWPDVREFNTAGLGVLSRAVVQDPPASGGLQTQGGDGGAGLAVAAMIVAMIVLEVVLLAGPAFAVGLRRQRRQLALIAAVGGDAPHLRGVVLASGTVIGGAAAVLGAAAGIVLAALAKPVVGAVTGEPLGPFEVPWLLIAVTMALGAGSGVLAALAPAVQASRIDVVAALAGRRDQARSKPGWPIAGAVLIAGGVLLSLVGVRLWKEFGAAFGTIAIIVGCVMIGPWVVGLAGRTARVLPLPLRLAVRDGARNRGRAAPAVAAIMAAVAGITALAIGGASDFEQSRIEYEGQWPLGSTAIQIPRDREAATTQAIAQELPGVPVLPLRTLPGEGSACPDAGPCPWASFAAENGPDEVSMNRFDTLVGGPKEARLLLGRDDPQVNAALAAGKVVLFRSRPLAGGTTDAAVSVMENDQTRTLRKLPGLPAIGVPDDPHVRALVPESVARRVALPIRTEAYGIDRADHRVTEAEQARLVERVAGLAPGIGEGGEVYVERGFTDSFGMPMLLMALAGGLLALGGSLIATGLSAADSRPDLATLAAIGARPRTRRLLMMGQAGFIAILGCWLGIAAGLVPGMAVARPLTDPGGEQEGGPPHGVIIDIPWTLLGVIGVAVPLLAMLAAGLFTRSRLPLGQRVTA